MYDTSNKKLVQTYNWLIPTEIKAAGNSHFVKGGGSFSEYSLVFTELSCLRINICVIKPAHRQATKP